MILITSQWLTGKLDINITTVLDYSIIAFIAPITDCSIRVIDMYLVFFWKSC